MNIKRLALTALVAFGVTYIAMVIFSMVLNVLTYLVGATIATWVMKLLVWGSLGALIWREYRKFSASAPMRWR